MVESDKGMLLPEFEVKAYDDQGLKPQNYYQNEKNRDKYWTSIFGGTEMRSLFTDYSIASFTGIKTIITTYI